MMPRTELVLSTLLALTGCARADAVAPAPEPATVDLRAAVSTTPAAEADLRVLVTGFNDWKDLGAPPNLWRCRDNPSCRLLLGDETARRPSAHAGPLVERLRAHASTREGRPIAWSFATMPVTWGIVDTVPDYLQFDVVVHLGLGVYDRFDVLQLEQGAFNGRRGTDAAGRVREEVIAAAQGPGLEAPAVTEVAARTLSLEGRRFGPYTVTVAHAREPNSYLCNETHFRALERLHASVDAGERLRRAHFLHIPYAERGDYATLADGVAGVVLALLE